MPQRRSMEIIASPSNPTGTQLSDEDLADIVETCRRLGITLDR